jgi:putative tryptophan/tyrosine transport system substrate-binding protein
MATLKRRDFVTLIGGAALMPFMARAQQAMPVIGLLNGTSAEKYEPQVAAFRQGLKESGFVDGENVTIEYRWAEGDYSRLAALAADLVKSKVAVIVANTPANIAAQKATDTIPIVFTTSSDPVAIGLVTNLNHPGGNVTGVSQLNVSLGPKRLELAHELLPAAMDLALLVNPNDATRSEMFMNEASDAATHLGLQLHLLRAGTEADIEAALGGFAQTRASALVVATDTFFTANAKLLAELSLRHKVPTIYEYTEFTDAGGLMSYGGNIKESYRWAGIYTGRILKGAKPADLPVQQSTTVELIVNLKTAKALGITVPLSLLGRADKIIE